MPDELVAGLMILRDGDNPHGVCWLLASLLKVVPCSLSTLTYIGWGVSISCKSHLVHLDEGLVEGAEMFPKKCFDMKSIIVAGLSLSVGGLCMVPSVAVAAGNGTYDGTGITAQSSNEATIEVSTIEELEHAVNSATGKMTVLVDNNLAVSKYVSGEQASAIFFSNPNSSADVTIKRKESTQGDGWLHIEFASADYSYPIPIIRIEDYSGALTLEGIAITPTSLEFGYDGPALSCISHGIEISKSADVTLRGVEISHTAEDALIISDESSCTFDGFRSYSCGGDAGVRVKGGSKLIVQNEFRGIGDQTVPDIAVEDFGNSVVNFQNGDGVGYRLREDGKISNEVYYDSESGIAWLGVALLENSSHDGGDDLPVLGKKLQDVIDLFDEGDVLTIYGIATTDHQITIPKNATIKSASSYGQSNVLLVDECILFVPKNASVPESLLTFGGDGAKIEGVRLFSSVPMDHCIIAEGVKDVSISRARLFGDVSPLVVRESDIQLNNVDMNGGGNPNGGLGSPNPASSSNAYTSIEYEVTEDASRLSKLSINNVTWLRGNYLKDCANIVVSKSSLGVVQNQIGTNATANDALSQIEDTVVVDGNRVEFVLDESGFAYYGKKPWEWDGEGETQDPSGDSDDNQEGVLHETIDNPDGSTTNRTTEIVVSDSGTVVKTITERVSGRKDGSSLYRSAVTVTSKDGNTIVSRAVENGATNNGTTAEAEYVNGELVSASATVSQADVANGSVILPMSEIDTSHIESSFEFSVSTSGTVALTIPVKADGNSGVPRSGVVLAVIDDNGTVSPCPKTAQVSRGLALEITGTNRLKVLDSTIDFPDIVGEEWYATSGVADFVSSRGILTGFVDSLGNVRFGGSEPTSRAMFVTMLARLEGEPKAKGSVSFADVPSDVWYANTVTWGVEQKLVSGYGDGGCFGGEDAVSREQMAVFLMRYADWLGHDISARASLDFSDADEISPWARDAVSWAVAEGYLAGYGSGSGEFGPLNNASRAEAAAVVMRFVNKLYNA